MKYGTINYMNIDEVDVGEIHFSLGQNSRGIATVSMSYGAQMKQFAVVTPPCVTQYPRCTGDGNYGTTFGPTDMSKAKYTLDICDLEFKENQQPLFGRLSEVLDRVDDMLLNFVHTNQVKILGRRNLSIDEVKMLQIRSVRPRYNKESGVIMAHSVNMSTSKYAWDGMGGKVARVINVCDHRGKVIKEGKVDAGDVVSATMYANQVYTGVGGDKFGIHWGFEDVCVVLQRSLAQVRTAQPVFGNYTWEFAQDYQTEDMQVDEGVQGEVNLVDQFGVNSEVMVA